MKSSIKWSPAVPARRQDNIVSSKAKENGELGFVPSYEKEPSENMNFVMSMEYRRIWFKERGIYSVETYSKHDAEMNSKDLKRRFVPRRIKKKMEGKLPPIKLKQFQNIPCKTDYPKVNKKTNEPDKELEA